MDLTELERQLNKMPESKVDALKNCIKSATNIYLLGNGGSSAVCSHIAQDYCKMLSKPALTFDNSSQLTCYTNDYGQDDAYLRWLQQVVGGGLMGSLVILISSSGNSENIWRCAEWCADKKVSFVLLTGFREDNSCRTFFADKAEIDYWVDSKDYGIVECLHQIFLHAVM